MAVTRPSLRHVVRPRGVSRVSVRVDDGMVVLAVSGNMDAVTAAAFAVELCELSAVCVGTLTVDLPACNEITTVVLGVSEGVHAASGSGRCRLTVLARHPEIATALRRAGIPEPIAGPFFAMELILHDFADGRHSLAHPDSDTWTVTQALQVRRLAGRPHELRHHRPRATHRAAAPDPCDRQR
jgi:hypothetical protein